MLTAVEREAVIEQMADFVARFGGMSIKSTGARVIDYTGVLYNTSGSSPDPKIDGKNWKALLEFHGIGGNCYADTPVAGSGNTHPEFLVGGHVTPNQDGSAPRGGTTYLMPLCKWHNSVSRNGKAFHHEQTRMLELAGYLLGEPAGFFVARMSDHAELTAVVLGEDGLALHNLVDRPDALAKAITGAGAVSDLPHVLLRRHLLDGIATYTVEEASLPAM